MWKIVHTEKPFPDETDIQKKIASLGFRLRRYGSLRSVSAFGDTARGSMSETTKPKKKSLPRLFFFGWLTFLEAQYDRHGRFEPFVRNRGFDRKSVQGSRRSAKVREGPRRSAKGPRRVREGSAKGPQRVRKGSAKGPQRVLGLIEH